MIFHDEPQPTEPAREVASLADQLRSAAKSLCVDPMYEIDRDLPVAAADEIERLQLREQELSDAYEAMATKVFELGEELGWAQYELRRARGEATA